MLTAESNVLSSFNHYRLRNFDIYIRELILFDILMWDLKQAGTNFFILLIVGGDFCEIFGSFEAAIFYDLWFALHDILWKIYFFTARARKIRIYSEQVVRLTLICYLNTPNADLCGGENTLK